MHPFAQSTLGVVGEIGAERSVAQSSRHCGHFRPAAVVGRADMGEQKLKNIERPIHSSCSSSRLKPATSAIMIAASLRSLTPDAKNASPTGPNLPPCRHPDRCHLYQLDFPWFREQSGPMI